MRDYLLMGLMAVLWAGAFVSGKLSVAAIPPEIVAFLRFLVAGLTMLAIMGALNWRELTFTRRDLGLILGLGATGIAGYNLLFFRGLHLAPASDGAMIVPTLNPLITLFVAAILLGERLTARKLTGASISLVGQVLIFWTLVQAAAADPTRLVGDLYYVGSAVCWSTYTILGRIAAKRFTPMAATTVASVAGMLMLLPFALWQYPGSSGYSLPFWGNILYLGWAATVAGFFLFNRGVTRLGASRAAVFINLVPVFSVALAALFLGERPTILQVTGMLVVLSGVYLAGTATPQAPAPARAS
ncbi:MAG: DMT family transporter [Bacillota bacterium]